MTIVKLTDLIETFDIYEIELMIDEFNDEYHLQIVVTAQNYSGDDTSGGTNIPLSVIASKEDKQRYVETVIEDLIIEIEAQEDFYEVD